MFSRFHRAIRGRARAAGKALQSKAAGTLGDCENFHKSFYKAIGSVQGRPAFKLRRTIVFKPHLAIAFHSRRRFFPVVAAAWDYLLRTAQDEVRMTCANFPADLQPHATSVPISYESIPSDALIDEGWDPDLLGMYVGDPISVGDTEAAPVPRQIILYLENIWDYADGEEMIYREEVRITFIHEFGHYLGLDEDGLDERGLL